MIICSYCTEKAVRYALDLTDEELLSVCQNHYSQVAGQRVEIDRPVCGL